MLKVTLKYQLKNMLIDKNKAQYKNNNIYMDLILNTNITEIIPQLLLLFKYYTLILIQY